MPQPGQSWETHLPTDQYVPVLTGAASEHQEVWVPEAAAQTQASWPE